MRACIKVKAMEATPESFAEYGQLIGPTDDGVKFGPGDAQLDLPNGIPRLYILHLENQPFNFSRITHHAKVTQCLGSVDREAWYLGVAKPSIVDDDGANERAVRSKCGHLSVPPSVDEIRVFRISGAKFVKLHKGTWHAGPLFRESARDFYILEITNTNEVDRTTYNFGKENEAFFEVEE